MNTTAKHTITLFRSGDWWMCRNTDPQVFALFGTDTLPTAYGSRLLGSFVRSKIKELNPDCVVNVAVDSK